MLLNTWPQLFEERITLSSGKVAFLRINCISWSKFFPLDSDLSIGYGYPLFEQMGPGKEVKFLSVRIKERNLLEGLGVSLFLNLVNCDMRFCSGQYHETMYRRAGSWAVVVSER